jgi:rRNA-processing protein FCF1
MKTIILDTDFILIPAKYRVDVFSEIDRICHFNYTLSIFDKTLEELDNLAKKGLKKEVKLTMDILKTKGLNILKSALKDKTVDMAILGYANLGQSIVATQDMALKRSLRAKQIPLITLRQKKYLILVQ